MIVHDSVYVCQLLAGGLGLCPTAYSQCDTMQNMQMNPCKTDYPVHQPALLIRHM